MRGQAECPALAPRYAPAHPTQPGVTLTEDAGEPGCAGHKAFKVHPESAVPVAASEGLGQLIVQVEA